MWKLSLLALLLAMTAGCSDDCSNNLVRSEDAPDAKHSAVLFRRDCGATTGFSTQISVVSAGAQATGSGNTFVADADHGAAQAALWGGPWAEMVWLAPNHLLVRHDAKARVFEQDEKVSGVKISFEPVRR